MTALSSVLDAIFTQALVLSARLNVVYNMAQAAADNNKRSGFCLTLSHGC